jgi:hypothetical protein
MNDMKKLFRTSWKFAPVLLLLLLGTVTGSKAQVAKLQLDQLDVLANRANDTVDVKLDERLIQTTSKFFSSKDPDDAEVLKILKGLKGIYVKSFTFENENEYTQAELETVLTQLRVGSWNKILTVISKKDGDNIEVYLNTAGDQINGLVVLSIQPKQLVVVNLVGPVDLERLSKLEGQFGVPDLDIETKKTKKDQD